LINTSSSHLIDDGSLKRALINGAVGGVALDGVEGPEWLEAWVSWFMILQHAVYIHMLVGHCRCCDGKTSRLSVLELANVKMLSGRK
jgi:hypothetical protein